ncbi:acyl-CoA dehydrogenase family protein [Streptomyces griseoviridis]|jgi:alkylation response protein AidB-like acyl-CoA dehydrogenase|uniref:Acyl-CoA dehydrogenase n=2 Tax=Streptomyces TaxID=1883 RepID=A0A918LFY8_STRGD|nr:MULTISPECIES: acyl-CoA dehydrogenase family protein [Streptomyces]GGS43422.1 acyl-CoA dehydrogenase [Streptomyces niveoruber]GGU14838.1 acyl-CoA dehydrogenase [Streptomyces daghestanicus]GHI35111.1 acyl-CoA dehydrogenase [Streptomyces daghestanicus]
MGSRLTEDQADFAAAVRDFAKRECGTREQRDALTDGGREPHHKGLYGRLADLGWLGVCLPEEYGGAGGGLADACVFLEETAYGLVPAGGFVTTVITAKAYERFGTEEQRRRVLGGAVRGAVLSIAMSEPAAGSDVGALRCRAARQPDGGWLVEGQKTWISNAHLAEAMLLVARTGQDKHQGLTMFHVPMDTPGVEVRGIETMGGREVNDVFLTGVRLPADAVVGEVGAGWRQLMAGLNYERLFLAANMLGLARRALDDAVAYVREREQFGRPVGSFQALRHRVADLATEIECVRLLVREVASDCDAAPDRLFPREASMAKLKATETAKRVTLECMQMMGGYGYATEYGMERHLRAAVVSTVYGGTSEIQRDIIGKSYGL